MIPKGFVSTRLLRWHPVRCRHNARPRYFDDRTASLRALASGESALTLLGLDEMMARYASYEDLAEIVRHRFVKPKETLQELFGRICFNVLCGNTNDHARNHAAFWDGMMHTLSPAYDICLQGRTRNKATQAMLIKGDNGNRKRPTSRSQNQQA